MAFFDFMKNMQKNKKVENVDIKQAQSARGAVHEGFDKPDEKKQVENTPIRLCYIALDGLKQDSDGKIKVGTLYGVTCVYNLPKGMNLKDASKVISYLTERIETKNQLEPASEMAVRIVSSELGNYGFRKKDYLESDFIHAFAESEFDEENNTVTVASGSSAKTDLEGVADLMTIDGDPSLFLCSDLAGKQLAWFTPDVKFDELKQIYEKLGCQINRNGVVRNAKPFEKERV